MYAFAPTHSTYIQAHTLCLYVCLCLCLYVCLCFCLYLCLCLSLTLTLTIAHTRSPTEEWNQLFLNNLGGKGRGRSFFFLFLFSPKKNKHLANGSFELCCVCVVFYCGQVGTFVTFTCYRAFLYATVSTFIAQVFGLTTLGRMTGFVFFSLWLFMLLFGFLDVSYCGCGLRLWLRFWFLFGWEITWGWRFVYTTAAVFNLLQYPLQTLTTKYFHDNPFWLSFLFLYLCLYFFKKRFLDI